MTDPHSDFLPVPIVDTSTIRFCTYCFRATDGDHVHVRDCSVGEFTQAIPNYWPPNWGHLKCVDFRYNTCYFPGCKNPLTSSKRVNMVRHLTSFKHDKDLTLTPDEVESKVVDVHSTIQANTLLHEDAVEKPPVPPDDVMNTDEARTGSSAIKEEEKQDMTPHDMDLGDITAHDHGANYEESVMEHCNESNAEIVENSDVSPPALKWVGYDTADSEEPCEQPLAPPSQSQPKEEMKMEMIDCKDCLVNDIKPPNEAVTDLPASSGGKLLKRSQFTCGRCKFTSSKPHVIKKHYRQNHQTKLLYLCEPCFFVSHNKYTYQIHWKGHHSGDPNQLVEPMMLESFDDDVVDKSDHVGVADSVSEYEELVVHNETNHNNYLLSKNNPSIKCKFCSFKTGYKHLMTSHTASLHYTSVSETLVNTADDTRTYRCITCGTITVSKQAAANHYVSLHVSFPTMRCELCEVDIRHKSNFNCHLKTEMHREYYRRSLRCPNCQFATLSKKTLQKHAAATHRISKSKAKTGEFACDKCKYVGSCNGDLNAHKKRVHGFEKGEDGFYRCDECDFKSSNKDKLIYHTKSAPDHSVAKNCVRCDVCNFAAFNLSGMLYHKSMIHGSSKSE